MKKSIIPLFIEKTWEMLFRGQHEDILRWRVDGNSFQILDEGRFVDEVLPVYFKHSNMSSFVRQLNMYNFHKRKTAQNTIEFHHKLFRRNQDQLLIGIKRKPSEADRQLGEQLLKALVPECRQQKEQEEFMREECSDFLKENILTEKAKLKESGQFLRPILGSMSWMQNGGQFNPWSHEKKIKTMVIKTPPQNDMENIYC